jgi:two-component system CitB family sensor kinase
VRFVSSTRRLPRLWTQILLLQLALIALTVGIAAVVTYEHGRDNLDKRAGAVSLALARSLATDPRIVRALTTDDHAARVIQPIATRVRKATNASLIVVADRRGIRVAHPEPQLIGKQMKLGGGGGTVDALAGKTYVGVAQGTLGVSVRAKVPVRAADGTVVGLVSVGVLERALSHEFTASLPTILIPLAAALLLGTLGAFLLSRRVKRQTFGLEPDEIAALLEQREAMLHGIREGALTVDAAGRITLINDEARRLLGLPLQAAGHLLNELISAGRVRDVLTGRVDGPDQVVLVGERVLVANRRPVELRGRAIGAVVTLRDRTELDALSRELNDVRALADGLRAQEHQFQHRLHVISGLIELGRYDDAVQEINSSSLLHQELAATLVERVGDPILAALLLGKAAVASEHGVKFGVHATSLPEIDDVHALAGMLGNLIDNAVESAAGDGPCGYVDVLFHVQDGAVVIRVHDSGPGIDPALTEEIFRNGYTTKVARDGERQRGLGLALVSHEVRRRGGTIAVENADGARFTVRLPLHAAVGAA